MTFLLGKRLLLGIFFEIKFALQGVPELRKLLVAVNPVHPLFGFQKAEREPPGPLFGVVPPLYPPDVVFNQAVQVLNRVGAFERPAHLLEDPKAMEREGLLQALLKGTGCRSIQLL